MPHDPIVYAKYQLLQLLARGGMGEVWKARSHGVEGFEKILVIKRILPELSKNTRFVEMFIDEAKVAVTLTHANVVQVFDLGRADGTYFIAMEYVPGYDLGTALRWSKKLGQKLPTELCVYIVSELAKGLDYAHRRRDAELRPLGIVHRDVSPENVLLSYEGEVKLTDFGIARSRSSVHPMSDLPVGKFAYLAPEQARGEAVDARADLFALGAILYEALSGTRAIEGRSAEESFARAKAADIRPLNELRPDLPQDLLDIVARAMARSRDDRYPNAGELYEDLIKFLYATGRRVGAHDLSRHLEDLAAQAAERPTHDTLAPLSGIEDIFSEHTGMTAAKGVTPLEVPPRSGSSSIPAPLPGMPARSEWRDVSVLAVDGLPRSEVMSLASRYGGDPYPNASYPDKTLVVFGLGEADGRDIQAAARCALRAMKVMPEADARALVHSGRVLVDPDGKAHHEQSLETLSRESALWLSRTPSAMAAASPHASKLLRMRFELAPPQSDGLRGIERERRADEGIGKFVGRREELRRVGEIFALANRGKQRVIGIKGDAGSGKSRLLMETTRRLRHAGHDVGMYVATCSPQGRTIPLQAIQELLRVVLGIEDMEPEARMRDKVDRLRLLGLSPAQRDAVGRALGLNLHLSSAANTSTLEAALMRIAYKLAQDKLTVFAWDSAEYMDSPSRELLGRLLKNKLDTRVVVLLTYRPSEPGPWVQSDAFTEVTLKALTLEDVGRLSRHRLMANEVPEDLVREINLKTGGNPLYVEELLNAMREAGVLEVRDGSVHRRRTSQAIELPRTLRGLVASRVGRLPSAQKLILQLAVTFGPRFVPELVARASQQDEAFVRQALSVLEERDIVRAISPSEYTFATELVREVLYDSIPLDERSTLHAAVATAIETLRPAELDAAVDRLAHHHREAGHREQAIAYLVRAAERFEAEFAVEPAIEAYGQAIDLLAHGSSPDRTHMLMLYARMGELSFRSRAIEPSIDRLGSALELAESLGRDEYVARFAMMRGRLLNKASRFQEGRMWLEKAHAVARRRGDRGLERDVALAAAEAHARNGEYTHVIQYVNEALELAKATEDVPAQVRCMLLVAPAYAAVGEGEVALSVLQDLAHLMGDKPDRLAEVELHKVRSLVAHQVGDHDGMVESARRALELAKEYGFPYEVAVNAHNLGEFYIRMREDSRAFAWLRLSYEVATEHGFARVSWLNVCLLGFLDAMRFASEQARTRMRDAVRYAEERGYTWDLIGEKYLLAIVEQKLGNLEGARGALREVIELADRHGHMRTCDDAEAGLRAVEANEPIPLPR